MIAPGDLLRTRETLQGVYDVDPEHVRLFKGPGPIIVLALSHTRIYVLTQRAAGWLLDPRNACPTVL